MRPLCLLPSRLLRRQISTAVEQKQCEILKGIKVLDMTRILAGPYCTMLLGDLGAEVFKIEQPGIGDETRKWTPPFAKPLVSTAQPESAYFLAVNRNKKSITVNIKSQKGKHIIQELAKKCDVLVENYLPGKLEQMGVGYSDLAKINPRLIYASITGYGQTGPYAHKPGYDVIIEAEAGLMHITGHADSEPAKVGVAITDLTSGLYAKSAILAALFERTRSGLGQHLDINLLDCQVASLANIASNFLVAGVEAQRRGTAHASIVPYQAYKTKDGSLVIGAGSDIQFESLCRSMDLPDLPADVRFTANKDRVANRLQINKFLESRFLAKTTDEWLVCLEGTGCPMGPINNIEQTFNHPQVKARGNVVPMNHPTVGPIKTVRYAVGFSRTPAAISAPPPVLGNDTREVLLNTLGMTAGEIEDLRKDGVI